MNKIPPKYSTKDFFNLRSKEYITNSDWANNTSLNEVIKNAVIKEKPSVVLDLGSGNGQILKLINWVKIRIAIDISQKMLDRIDDRDIIKVLSDIHNMPIPDQYVDFIICRQVLHYCNLDIIFKETLRVLKNNGKLFVIQMTDFNSIPDDWYIEWKSFKKIINRQHLRSSFIKEKAKSVDLIFIEEYNIRINTIYSWEKFYQKYFAETDYEKRIIYDFFKNSPEQIKHIINLSINETHISFDRNFSFILFGKSQ